MTGRVVVVGLGPAGPDLVTTGTLDAIERIPDRYLRTTRHPASSVVPGARSFDDLYEEADEISEVYEGIVETLVGAARAGGEVLYAVPGSPLVAERTVELLLAQSAVDVEVLPALSFLDLAWVRLGVDPTATGVRIVDGHRFAVEGAGERGPLLVVQVDRPSVLSDIKLSVDPPPDEPVLVVARLGSPDETVAEVAWVDLDRAVEADHLTSLWIPRLAAPVAGELAAFDELVARLRDECPWDREQTHRSLTPYLVEETYEVVEALDRLPDGAGALDRSPSHGEEVDDAYAALEEELGDLLFQIVFHSRLAAEAGRFTLADVARGIHQKLVERHPHVFGDLDVGGDAREVERNWDRIKSSQEERRSTFDGVPVALPPLARLSALVRRAERAGIDVRVEQLGLEPGPASDLGRAVVTLVAEASRRDVDVDGAVRAAARRLEADLRTREPRAPVQD